MKKKVLILLLVLFVVAIFVTKGIPLLKTIKSDSSALTFASSNKTSFKPINFSGKRPVTVDLSIESMCTDFITNKKYTKCNKDNCDNTCMTEGCKFFGLNYLSSEYKKGRCYCNCYEENKIKKALNPQIS